MWPIIHSTCKKIWQYAFLIGGLEDGQLVAGPWGDLSLHLHKLLLRFVESRVAAMSRAQGCVPMHFACSSDCHSWDPGQGQLQSVVRGLYCWRSDGGRKGRPLRWRGRPGGPVGSAVPLCHKTKIWQFLTMSCEAKCSDCVIPNYVSLVSHWVHL